jgi:hypothetical protein
VAKRFALLLCLAALLGGCSADALPYRSPFDRFVVTLGLEQTLNYYPCTVTYVEQGYPTQQSIPPVRCYRFDPPRRMRGVWVNVMEGSEFFPDVTRAPPITDPFEKDRTWLETPRELWDRLASEPKSYPPTYAIEFIGRNATYPGSYGGDGSRHLILLDRLLSIRAIESPKSLSREQFEAKVRQLRASEPAPPPRWRQAVWLACPDFLCLPPRPEKLSAP